MDKRYYQPEIETMPVDQIKALQAEKLVKQVKYVYENVKYYRDLMDKKGVKPEDIKTLDDALTHLQLWVIVYEVQSQTPPLGWPASLPRQ